MTSSLSLRLSLSLSAAILLLALVAGAISFSTAYGQAHALQDDVLHEVAALLDQGLMRPGPVRLQDGNEETRIIVQPLAEAAPPAAGRPAANADIDAGAPLPLSPTLSDGLQTIEAGGEAFRLLIHRLPDGRRIAIAQETGLRDLIARDGALRTVMPLLGLIPILLLLVVRLVRRMFRPIIRLAAAIDRRSEQDQTPLDLAGLPMEIRPFVVAINRLLERTAQAMADQRRFVADAAHELRSPLTALSLQAERLEAEMPQAARDRLIPLRRGIERSRVLIGQLLTLARLRAETAPYPAAPPPEAEPVSALWIYRRVLEDLLPLAERKEIDMGITGGQDAILAAPAMDLLTLVKNLVDNAIRHTPPRGRIDLSVQLDPVRPQAVLQIDDNGPGIAPDQRERVFAPFHRGTPGGETGAGLGLAIVRAIAERNGASLSLDYADPATPRGLRVRVRLPLA
ncbi:sensor protein QseC [mine drainage metagenome]|uniref:histidine kinase n=1 Tax=mine drainage metagenome TaxID=410659 RepID=A0A1J5QWK3_9ZZZZ